MKLTVLLSQEAVETDSHSLCRAGSPGTGAASHPISTEVRFLPLNAITTQSHTPTYNLFLRSKLSLLIK